MSINGDFENPLASSTGSVGGGGDDAASQSSQRSGRSLLERIQMQREREALQVARDSNNNNNHGAPATIITTTPQQIHVPQYHPNQSHGDFQPSPEAGTGNFFSNAWNNIAASMESGMASVQHDDAIDEALLAAPSSRSGFGGGEQEYSMTGYFLTIVRDVYGMFQSLPIWARWVVCLALLYVALKLL